MKTLEQITREKSLIEAPGKALQQQGATIADGLQQAVRTAYWHDRRRALLEREKRTTAAA